MLFCLSLTVISPLTTLYSLTTSLFSLATVLGENLANLIQFPGLLAMLAIDALLSVAVTAFSIFAGIGLWCIWPGAVRTAKEYLWCFLGYHIIGVLLPLMTGLPWAAQEAMILDMERNAIRSAFYFAIWYAYLKRSERVKATYQL